MKNKTLDCDALITWVYTRDLEVSADFYARGLGLECRRDEGRARIFTVTGDACIGVCEAFDDRVVEPRGSMISFVVDDVDAWYQSFESRGVAVDSPPRRLEQFKIYTFFVRDPDGYVIEFQQFD